MKLLPLPLGLSVLAAWTISSSFANETSPCRYLPGDENWPSPREWDQLNKDVNGGLIATTPLAQSCYWPTYHESQCKGIREEWISPVIHFQDSASVQNPYWLNNSCTPFTGERGPHGSCTHGNIAEYAINVTFASDVAAGLKFAKEKNIRLVIKNTGHDFLGRSCGKGSLLLWTHNLKDIEFLDYSSEGYTGRAARLGAGVQGFEAYAAAHKNNSRIVGGWCPTVGIVGGYTQGAGHGPLAGSYGLGADNTLEWEVVTAEGEHIVATPENEHSDLYWALSGGGGGTYAVVLSLTTKAHPDIGPVGGAQLTINSSDIPADTYWEAVEAFHAGLGAVVDNKGLEAVYTLSNASFFLNFLTWTGHGAGEVEAVLKEFTDYLEERNIPYDPVFSDHPGFYPHYAQYTPGLPYGIYEISHLIGGRLIPSSVVEENNPGLTSALRNITSDPKWILNGVTGDVSHARVGNTHESNAVVPAWRDALIFFNIVAVWDPENPIDDLLLSEHQMTNDIVPQLERITPGSGSYINEGDFNNPHWKQDYFGSNFERLLDIKKRYDPDDLFYAIASVGSEDWSVAGDGRLCRT